MTDQKQTKPRMRASRDGTTWTCRGDGKCAAGISAWAAYYVWTRASRGQHAVFFHIPPEPRRAC